jgi:aryl-alcohol dehydrogenase-like predicted oxidoreductase
MRFRALGRSDVQLSAIGFGAWAIGGGNWIEGWGRQDDEDSIAAVHRACDLGVNWIDTAGAYGYGHSEEVIAQALHGMQDPPMVFTKCTSIWDKEEARRTRAAVGARRFETAGEVPGGGHITSCLRRDSIRREVEGSLSRLRVDVLDMCQIHLPLPDADIEEGWAALAELRDEGKIRLIGVSNFDVH